MHFFFRKPEIGEFDVAIDADEDILGLEVTGVNLVVFTGRLRPFCGGVRERG
jgi:hypothetical protein